MTTVDDRDLVLEAHGIEKAYLAPTGRLPVLTGVDLEVTRGTVLAILGVSGVGKSTLLNILGTLDRPDHGRLTIRGRRVDDLSEGELAGVRARRVGFVFQFHHLLPEFTAEENVMMPLLIAGVSPDASRARARDALSAVGLRERWEHVPSELSGGEARRGRTRTRC
jgi:lipoprotein-releasing system ATP-binding protein